VQPEVLESRLAAKFGIDVMATGMPDMKWGEKLVLIVEEGALNDSSGQTGEDASDRCVTDYEILEFCRECMPKESVPKQIVRARLPRTGNGKPDRVAGRKLVQRFG